MQNSSYIINNIKFYINADEALAPVADILAQEMKSIPVDRIYDDYKFEIGFSVFTCKAKDDGFTIVAPDYLNSPFLNTTDDLTIPLWILMEQTTLLNEYKADGVPTRFDEEIVIAENALSSSLICLQRFSDLGKGASGWCVESIEKRQDDKYRIIETKKYHSCYAYELLQKRESLIKALAFPYGYLIVFDTDNIVEILDENDISLKAADSC